MIVIFDISDFSPETPEHILTKHDMNQALNVLYQGKWKYRGMFETQKVRRHDKFRKEWSQHNNKCKSPMGQYQVSGGVSVLFLLAAPVANDLWKSLCFCGPIRKRDGRSGLSLAETFSTSPLKRSYGIKWSMTGSNIPTSTKLCFMGADQKNKKRALIGWDIFDFSSLSAEQNSMIFGKKQDLYIIYQVCVFRANPSNRLHIVLRCTLCGPIGLLFNIDCTVVIMLSLYCICSGMMTEYVHLSDYFVFLILAARYIYFAFSLVYGQWKNKTNHPISSNSHASATASTKYHFSKIVYISIHSVLISKIDNFSIQSVLLWHMTDVFSEHCMYSWMITNIVFISLFELQLRWFTFLQC